MTEQTDKRFLSPFSEPLNKTISSWSDKSFFLVCHISRCTVRDHDNSDFCDCILNAIVLSNLQADGVIPTVVSSRKSSYYEQR